MARDFIAAANAADPAARAAWLRRRVATKPVMPAAAFKTLLDQLARDAKGLTLISAADRGEFLKVIAATGAGPTARFDLFHDRTDPSRLEFIGALAAPTPYPKPLVDGPVGEAELKAAIAERVRFAAGKGEFSGAVLVMKGDKVLYRGAFGEADKDFTAPNRIDTRFNLGSMDKQFTAVAIGQLIEAGKLTLDTRLIDVLPHYPNVDAARKVTIRHLLTHTAGFGALFDRPGWEAARLKPIERVSDLLPIFAKEPLQYEPGQGAAYANEGFVVLGAVVEKLSGQSWYDYVRDHVFVPAGMTHTASLRIDEIAAGRAVGYRFAEDDPIGLRPRRPNWNVLGYRGNSCGGGYSTSADMVAFLKALHDGQLLKPQTVELFTAEFKGGIGGYGMGFQRTDVAGHSLRGHNGGGPFTGVNSDAQAVWETGYYYAVMGNYDSPFAQTLGGDIGKMLAAQR